ncbi:MAG TPA: hypothetical protein VHX88_01685, partial [Solirubrobacteraceae bacterium]|nr:hypothetical protein [Solirubrobacteraceae bacterium]
NPSLIKDPSNMLTLGGRKYMIFSNGGKIHLIAWKQGGVLYWVDNTLLTDLSNDQMLDIARSTQPVG